MGVLPDPRFSASRFGAWAGGPINDTGNDPGTASPSAGSMVDQSASLVRPGQTSFPAMPSGGGGAMSTAPDPGAFKDQGPGGFNSTTGSAYFEDGGEVEDDGSDNIEDRRDNDPSADTRDPYQRMANAGPERLLPMQDDLDNSGVRPKGPNPNGPSDGMDVIRKALQMGRQHMGLPGSFFGGEGEQNGSSAQQGFDDGGEVEETAEPQDQGQDQQSQDQGQGVIQQPQQQGPPDPRNALKYLTGDGAVRAEIAEALERHVDPQGTMDPAERKMAAALAAPDDKSRFGYLQHLRTEFNGHSGAARAALRQGQLGAAAHYATQAFAALPSGQTVKFAPANGGIAMLARGAQQQSAASGGEIASDATNPSVLLQSGQKGYDDGGEVEEEGVIPTEQTEAAPEPEQEAVTAPVTEAPQEMTPEQFAKVVDPSAFDKVADKGWADWVSEILGSAMGVSSAQAGEIGTAGVQAEQPKSGKRPDQMQPGRGDKFNQQQSVHAQGVQGLPSPEKQAQVPYDTKPLQNSVASKKEPGEEELMQKRIQMLERIAQKRFPMLAGDAAKRDQWVNHMMDTLYGNDKTVNQATARGEAAMRGLEVRGQQAKERTQITEEGKSGRNAASNARALTIAELNASGKKLSAEQSQMVRMIGQQIAAHPEVSNDPAKLLKLIAPLAQKVGLNPQDLITSGGQQGQQPQAGGQQKPQGRPFVVDPKTGQKWALQPDGKYRPAE